MFSLLVFVGVGSTFCQVISGLTLISSNIYGSTNGFSLTCKVQGAITTQMTLADPAGNVAAGCLQPPDGCGSAAGNTFDRNIPEGTFTVNIKPSNVDITNHKGVWTCTDGVNVAQYEIKDIVSYTEPIIQSEVEAPVTGSVVTVLIGCIYPYPDEVKISYVKESSLETVLKSRSDVKFDNGSSVNCKISDARAISMNGSFLVSTDNLNGEEARIAVTALLNGTVLGKTGYSNFTIKSEKDCKLEIRLFGSLPVSLCVPITSIVIIILLILKKEPFFKRFGELTKKKVLIIILFILVAIIIGLCLGLLIEGICDKKYLALGLSFLFAILLAVALFGSLLYYHKKFESKKDIQDGGAQDGNGSSQNNTGSNTTRTTTERVGSPASTSNVELAAKNKAGVPKGEQSALKQKEINTPLPLPPSGNSQYLTASTNNLPVSRNKLDPIVMENEEPNPSERKKKKRKKKKRKNEKNVDEAGDNED